MSKSPKFLVADNPMAEPNAEYVYHNQRPRFLAKYTPDSPLSHFEIIDDIDDMAAFFKQDPMKVAGLMRRLGDWWIAYCKFEDENTYEQEN